MKYIKKSLTLFVTGAAVLLFAAGSLLAGEEADSVSVSQYHIVTLEVTGMT